MTTRKIGFRTRFILLILIAVLPGIVIAIVENFRQHDTSYRNEIQDLEEITNAITAAQEKTIFSIKQSLITAALLAQQAEHNKENCQESLSRFLSQLSYYNNLLIVDSLGKPVCSAKPLPDTFNVVDRPYFQKALKEGRIATSGYLLSRTTGKPSVAFAFPILSQGHVSKVAIVSVEVKLFTSILENIKFTKKLIAGITDDAGNVLARRPTLERLEGKKYPVDKVLDAIRKKSPAHFKALSADGVERFFWIAPVLPELDAPFIVFVASSHEDLLSPFDQILITHLLSFLLTLLIAFAGIWHLGEQWMIKPVHKILAAIGKISKGQFSAQTGVNYRQGELGMLAHHVDDMAKALEKREAEARTAKEKIEALARTDDVSGLPNRVHFKEFLERQIEKGIGEEKSFCVMFVDLDKFRVINDAHGHSVGDDVLRATGQRIRQAIADHDFVARLSADSFACVLPSCSNTKTASQTADRIMESLRHPHLVGTESINLDAKIGISVFPTDSTNSSTLLKYADTAMRRAKASGKRGIEMFDPVLDAQMLTEWNLHVDLSHAVERNELLVYYQPKISARTGALAGYEALVRWMHPIKGLVSPAHFIPLAESTRLIIPIGEWVLTEACKQGNRWIESGLPRVPIAVNVSAEQFQHSDFRRTVERVLAMTTYPAELLELEITEGVLLRGVEKELEKLRALGIKLSVDDFGTGYSSLSYLRHMPVNKLKVDQSFVRGITENPADKAITAAIVGMAKSLELSVVAEGVETEEALQFLREIGCDEIQGYYYSKPLPPKEVELFCRSLDLR